MDDPGAAKLRGRVIAARRAEAETVLALMDYVEGFHESYRWRTGELSAPLNRSHQYPDPGSAAREAAITYAAQALGWSQYRTQRAYNDAALTQQMLPSVWEWFTHLRITTLAVSKIAQAARRLRNDEDRLARLDTQVPARAAELRPTELDDWLRRFTAIADPEQHAEQCARNAEGRYGYIRPCEDIEGMSLLIAQLPTLVAETMGRRLGAVARSHSQKIPHNPVTAGLAAHLPPRTDSTTAQGLGQNQRPVPPGPVRGSFGHILYNTSEPVPSDQTEPAQPTAASVDRKFSRWRQATNTAPAEPVLAESYDHGDTRTLAQREADLLTCWVLQGTTPGAKTALEAQISILVPIETLTDDANHPGVSSNRGEAVPAGVIRYLARSPSIRKRWHCLYITDDPLPAEHAPREYFYGPTGVEFNIAAHTYQGYQVPKLLREHIVLRDGQCTVPGCTRPAERGDIDHHAPWPTGDTTAANLRALCRTHHNIKRSPIRTLNGQPSLRARRCCARSLPGRRCWSGQPVRRAGRSPRRPPPPHGPKCARRRYGPVPLGAGRLW